LTTLPSAKCTNMRPTMDSGIFPGINCAKDSICLFLAKSFQTFTLELGRYSMRATIAFVCLIFLAAVPASSQSGEQKIFLGFDRNDYPGDEAMKLLRKDFAFTSYWLSNPPQTKSNSWSGKREFLRSLSYGFLPLFNGPTSGELRDQSYTTKRVAYDIQSAAAAARREGFPKGTVIFLDVEEGGRLPSTYATYLKHWALGLAQLGFRAGVYCSAIP